MIRPAASTSAPIWLYCSEHKTCWCVGGNLFGDWRSQTEEEQRARYDALDFDSYHEVKPVWPVLQEAGTNAGTNLSASESK